MKRTKPLLFDAFPALEKGTPWMPIANVPTAVEPMTAIEPWLGRSGVFMKRDDLIHPLYGGNKVRRWEFVLADAKRKGKTKIVTLGGLASTQATATTLFGKELGFGVHIVLFDQAITEFGREAVRGMLAAGATVEYGGNYVTTAYKTWRAYRRAGKDAYFIMMGASNPLANLGFIDAMLELEQQVARKEAPRPDIIAVPTGSAGTLAAIALGVAHFGWPTEVVGVRIATPIACNRFMVDRVIAATDAALVKRAGTWKSQKANVRYTLYKDALGPGYGEPTPTAREGIERIRELTGAPGEVTYSGKALDAVRALAKTQPHANILFWNTLSTPRPTAPADLVIPPPLRFIFEGEAVA